MSRLTVLLALLALGLGGLLGHRLASPGSGPGEGAIASGSVSASATGSVPGPNVGSDGVPTMAGDLLPPSVQLPPLAALTETVHRPLFSPDRRPPEPTPPTRPAVATTAGGPPTLNLSAVVLTDGDRVALVEDVGRGQLRRLREGEEIAGWWVESVESEAVVLARGQARHRIALRRYQAAPPPGLGGAGRPPPAPPRGDRPVAPTRAPQLRGEDRLREPLGGARRFLPGGEGAGTPAFTDSEDLDEEPSSEESFLGGFPPQDDPAVRE
jgi:hypothetical protein